MKKNAFDKLVNMWKNNDPKFTYDKAKVLAEFLLVFEYYLEKSDMDNALKLMIISYRNSLMDLCAQANVDVSLDPNPENFVPNFSLQNLDNVVEYNKVGDPGLTTNELEGFIELSVLMRGFLRESNLSNATKECLLRIEYTYNNHIWARNPHRNKKD
jgi:hypothetical protein